MKYHDKSNLNLLQIPVREYPWYYKIWGYPLKWGLNGVAKILGVER